MRTFVLAVFALALLACDQSADNPISQTQAREVRAPEVELLGETAKTPEQDAAVSPATPATAEPAKVEEPELKKPEESELVTTTFPPLGMLFSVPTYDGPATMERRIVDADIIAIVSLASSTPAVETLTHEGQTGYVGALKFTFTVEELIKSPAGSSPSQLVAMVGSLQAYAERSDAQAKSEMMARDRDTQWDDRQAIVFLATHSLEFPGSSDDDLYFMSFVDFTYGLGDTYSIASIRNQLWLPEAKIRGGAGGASQERRFLTGIPQQVPDTSPRAATVSTQTEMPSISLNDFKATVSRIEAELAGQSEAYHFCVQQNYERKQLAALWTERGRTYMSPETFTPEIGSGEKAGTEIIYDTRKIILGPNGWESRTELLGADATLFRIGETTKSGTRNYGALNSINAKKSDPELVRHVQPMETDRPLPRGFYSFTWKYHRAEYVLCAPDVFYNHTVTVTVTAPSGVLHEAFFDPVTDGSAIAADSSNGILKPAAFTDANSASATIQRIEWASGTVKVKVSPHTGLAGQTVDFIELDGSVSLSLNIDDATVDAANNTLGWSVSSQPWHDGDKLMVRIHKALPAPQDASVSLSAGTFTISWSAVTGAAEYRAQHRTGGAEGEWTDLDATTGTSQTFSPEGGVVCGTTYEFRVQGRGDGTTHSAAWGRLSESASHTTGACNRAPVFGSSSYSFSVAENASVWHTVGTVSATDPDEGDFVSYSITAGNVGGVFNISSGRNEGLILVGGALDYETVSSYTLTVEARDGKAGGTSSATVEISVTDVAE